MLDGCTPWPPELVARYRASGCWRNETIASAIRVASEVRLSGIGKRPAVKDSERELPLDDLLNEADRVARLLRSRGLRKSDRIVIQLPNSIEFVSLLIACAETGIIPVMALPAFRRAELQYLAEFSEASAIAVPLEYRGFDHARLALELASAIPTLKWVFSIGDADGCIDLCSKASASESYTMARPEASDVALFLLSGGTTGLPKLIPRTHADYLYNAREAARACGLKQDSRILLALPIEHNFPLACPGLVGALLTGATAVLCASTQPADLCATIEREQITHLPCVPALAMALLEFPGRSKFDLSSLSVITVGGAKLKAETAARLKRELPQIKVQQVFGMAEGLLCFTALDDSDEIAFETQGRPMSSYDEIRIVDENGIDSPAGAVGELWCRGPYTLRGYYKAPERNREAFTPDGFYRSGDLVRLHPSGNLIVEGRIKDLINRGGEKISAEEVEGHLLAHPAVASAAVVAMPDPALGERSCAYVTLRPGQPLTLEVVREFLAARELARFKWPERLEIIDQMPLTNVGKLQKTELRRDIDEKLKAEAAGNAAEPASSFAKRT